MSAKTTRRFRWFLIGSIALCGAGFGFASDAADEPRPRFVGADPAFWVDPAEPSRSTLIGQRGEAVGVYDLRGSVIQSLSQASLQADLRHGVVMDGRAETIAALSGGPVAALRFYRVDAVSRALVPLETWSAAPQPVLGSCLYLSPVTHELYVFALSPAGSVTQLRVEAVRGRLELLPERRFEAGAGATACAADDELGFVYVGAGSRILKLDGEPFAPAVAAAALATAQGPQGIQGLAIYRAGEGTGYLLASQGTDEIAVYRREGDNQAVTSLRITPADAGRRAAAITGIDVVSSALGDALPFGALAAQDRDELRVLPWEELARSAPTPLTIGLASGTGTAPSSTLVSAAAAGAGDDDLRPLYRGAGIDLAQPQGVPVKNTWGVPVSVGFTTTNGRPATAESFEDYLVNDFSPLQIPAGGTGSIPISVFANPELPGRVATAPPGHLPDELFEIFARDVAYRDWANDSLVEESLPHQYDALGLAYRASGTIRGSRGLQAVSLTSTEHFTIRLDWYRASDGFYYGSTYTKVLIIDWDRPPVLAFRGTEPTLSGIADVFSDLSPNGVGFSQFSENIAAINAWARDAFEPFHESPDATLRSLRLKPGLTGHSLGGALTQWAGAYFTEAGRRLGQVVTFNSAGISREAQGYGAQRFLPANVESVTHYVNSGDVVSMAGEEFLPPAAAQSSQNANWLKVLYRLPLEASLTTPFRIFGKHSVPLVMDDLLKNGEWLLNPVEHPTPDSFPSVTKYATSVGTLSAPGFSYLDGPGDPDYLAFVAAVSVLAGDNVGAALIFRETTETARKTIGTLGVTIKEAAQAANAAITTAARGWSPQAFEAIRIMTLRLLGLGPSPPSLQTASATAAAFSASSGEGNFWSTAPAWPNAAWGSSPAWPDYAWQIMSDDWTSNHWNATGASDFPWQDTPTWTPDEWRTLGNKDPDDETTPLCLLVGVPPEPITGGPVTFTVRAQDDESGIGRVELRFDDQLYQTQAGSRQDNTYTFSWTPPPQTKQLVRADAVCYDNGAPANEARDWRLLSVRTVPGQDGPPQLDFLTLVQGAPLVGPTPVRVKASDNQGVRVVLDIFGPTQGELSNPTSCGTDCYEFLFDPPVAGRYRLVAIGTETSCGSTCLTASLSADGVLVDLTPPTIAVASPAAGASITDRVHVVLDARDDLELRLVELFAKPESGAERLLFSSSSPPWKTRFCPAATGPTTLRAVAHDRAGRSSEASLGVQVPGPVSCIVPATVAITRPTQGQTLTGEVVLTARANATVNLVEFTVPGVLQQLVGTYRTEGSERVFEHRWNTVGFDGARRFRVYAVSPAGTDSESIDVTVSNPPPPRTEILEVRGLSASPLRGAVGVYVRAHVPAGRSFDSVRFYVDGRLEATGTSAQVSSVVYSSLWTWQTKLLPNGSHRVRIEVRDAAAPATREIDVTLENAPLPPGTGAGGWCPADPLLAPAPRSFHQMVAVPPTTVAAGQCGNTLPFTRPAHVLAFGGSVEQQRTHELWRFAYGQWSELTPETRQVGVDWPQGAGGLDAKVQLAYDGSRRKVVLLRDSGGFWEWDVACEKWERRTAVMGFNTGAEPWSMVYDSGGTGHVVVHGTEPCCQNWSTWEWDGGQLTRHAGASDGDYRWRGARGADEVMYYRPDGVELVSTRSDADPNHGDKAFRWRRNGRSWEKKGTSNNMAPRRGLALTYQPDYQRSYALVGFETNRRVFRVRQGLDDGWLNIHPSAGVPILLGDPAPAGPPGPSARWDHAMAYDDSPLATRKSATGEVLSVSGDELVLFGGRCLRADGTIGACGDTWTWRMGQSSCPSNFAPPPKMEGAAPVTFPAPYGYGITLSWTATTLPRAKYYEVQYSIDGETWLVYTRNRDVAYGGWINHHGEVSYGEYTMALPSGQTYYYLVRVLDKDHQPLSDWSTPSGRRRVRKGEIRALKATVERYGDAPLMTLAEPERFPNPWGHGIHTEWTPTAVANAAYYDVQVATRLVSPDWVRHQLRPLADGAYANHTGNIACEGASQCLPDDALYFYRVQVLDGLRRPLTPWSNVRSARVADYVAFAYHVGDWDGDGSHNLAVRREALVEMDVDFDALPDLQQSVGGGDGEDEYLVGDWDGDGRDNLAVRRNNCVLMDTTFDATHDRQQCYGSEGSFPARVSLAPPQPQGPYSRNAPTVVWLQIDKWGGEGVQFTWRFEVHGGASHERLSSCEAGPPELANATTCRIRISPASSNGAIGPFPESGTATASARASGGDRVFDEVASVRVIVEARDSAGAVAQARADLAFQSPPPPPPPIDELPR